MKKIVLGLSMLFALMATVQVEAQTTTTTTSTTNSNNGNNSNTTQSRTRVKYWYYPSANVYYNDATGDYWYYDDPSTTWMDVKTLPSTYVVNDQMPRYEVWYNGTDVWKENAKHLKKYKVKKNGRVKEKEAKM